MHAHDIAMHKPTFIPKPGQTDYTHAKRAPVVNSLIRFRDEDLYLLIKRSSGMRLYPNLWNGISGFLDDEQSVEQKIRSEIAEETGLSDADILAIVPAAPFEQDDRAIDRIWEVHPALVALGTQEIRLNWEGQEYAWVPHAELLSHDLVPGYQQVIAACRNLRIDVPA